jgi:hypothetical protein
MPDAKEWIIQRCTERRRPTECVGRFELIYEDFDIGPVTEERMRAEAAIICPINSGVKGGGSLPSAAE